ncbi:MAG TPA: FixH family protein [Terriglobales bacterium]|nr:FixH family protein [Terriglobales bacterium]
MSLTSDISPKPARVGINEIAFSLSDAGSPATGGHFRLEADMVHPGMAPVFADAKEIAPGQYEGALDINMPGDWVVLVHGKLANGQKFERQIPLNGVEAK